MSNQLTHLGLILDGNRRWANEQGKKTLQGHTEGLKNFKQRVLNIAERKEIDYLTAYTLSTENFQNRSQHELEHLFSLIEDLIEHKQDFLEHNIELKTIGKTKQLPDEAQQTLSHLKDETRARSNLTLTLALNYGGRDEIVRGAQKLLNSDQEDEDLTEENFAKLLDSRFLPPMDLLIRTGGHKRISNFILWNIAYSEFYFTDTLWPAFDEEELGQAINYFHQTKRKFGA
jgi:undecaprenyl diphosphate synthase